MKNIFKKDFSLVAGVALLLIFIGCLAGAAAAALLLFSARLLISRLVALAAIGLLSTAAWAAVNARLSRVPGPTARRLALSATGFSFACLAACAVLAPSGDPGPDSGLSSVFRGKARFNKWSPAWLVSEGDQARLGGFIMPFADKLIAFTQEGSFRGAMTFRQNAEYIRAFNSIYGELERRKDFMETGSALGEAYADTFLGLAPVGHMYVYVPPAKPKGPLPVLVFMHGWLGNMKAYPWAWREFAEANGFAVLMPSWGNGVWDTAAGADMVRWVEQYIRSDTRFDPGRVYVAGESNGGTGVTQWARTASAFSGLVYIAAIMDGAAEDARFAAAAGKRPVLIIYGDKDTRIPQEYALECFIKMKAMGVKAEVLRYRDEDHIMVITERRRRLQDDLLAWIRKNEKLKHWPDTRTDQHL